MKVKRNILLTSNDVKKIALLAKLSISKNETVAFARQLSEVLKYFDKLSEVDTSSIKPTYHPVKSENRFQEQLAREKDTLTQDQVLSNAKEKRRGYILTKAVIDHH